LLLALSLVRTPEAPEEALDPPEPLLSWELLGVGVELHDEVTGELDDPEEELLPPHEVNRISGTRLMASSKERMLLDFMIKVYFGIRFVCRFLH
jgi:hypothetical protein